MIPLSKLQEQQRELVMAARAARRHAHAPYSGFRVGAAVRARNGDIFSGCNVETISFGAGICAERGAILHAASQGLRPGQLLAVAVYTRSVQITPPCGMCLQVLQEFAKDPEVLLANAKGTRVLRLRQLLPLPFSPFDDVPEIERSSSPKK